MKFAYLKIYEFKKSGIQGFERVYLKTRKFKVNFDTLFV